MYLGGKQVRKLRKEESSCAVSTKDAQLCATGREDFAGVVTTECLSY